MRAIARRGDAVMFETAAAEAGGRPAWAADEPWARLRVLAAAVLPADLAVARGEIDHQGVMGHAFVGVAEEIDGEDRRDLLGRRVACEINIPSPGSELARRGLGAHDPDRRVLGLRGMDGCFADLVAAPADHLVPVPEGVSDEQAALLKPLADAAHASKLTRLERKPFVTILGDSLDALLCAQVMTRLNASVRIVAAQDRVFRLCERFGVRHRLLADVGRRQDQDVVIDCTGASVGLALRLVRPRGVVLARGARTSVPGEPAAQHPGSPGRSNASPDKNTSESPDERPDLSLAVLNEVQIIGARCGSVHDGLAALATGGIDLSSLVTKSHRLADGVAALRSAAEPEHVAVLVKP